MKKFEIRYSYNYSRFFGWRAEPDYNLVSEEESSPEYWGCINWRDTNSHGGTSTGTAIIIASSIEEAIAILKIEEDMKYMSFEKEFSQIEKKLLSVACYRANYKDLNKKGIDKYCKLRDAFLINKKKELVAELLNK